MSTGPIWFFYAGGAILAGTGIYLLNKQKWAEKKSSAEIGWGLVCLFWGLLMLYFLGEQSA